MVGPVRPEVGIERVGIDGPRVGSHAREERLGQSLADRRQGRREAVRADAERVGGVHVG